MDLLLYERALIQQGVSEVIGIDEVGRGPLAGPVVAAAFRFPLEWLTRGLPPEWRGLTDSKKLSESRRLTFYEIASASDQVAFGIGDASAQEIDELNILNATHLAMVRAVEALESRDAHHLVDGLPVPPLGPNQTAIPKGDSISASIAAASVMAKVTRDRRMGALDAAFPQFGFGKHKGYGTAQHRAAILAHGPSPHHRRSFEPVKSMIRR